jgi:hypothetical protein
VSSNEKANKRDWQLTGPWAGAWKVFAGIGALGLIGAGAGYASDPRRFAFSYLFAYITVLLVALGMLFFVLVQRLVSAGWSVTVRRTAEFFAVGLLVMLPLFLPVLATMNTLFPWMGQSGGEHAAEPVGSLSLVKPAFAQEHAPEGTPAHGNAPPSEAAEPAGKPAGAHVAAPGESPDHAAMGTHAKGLDAVHGRAAHEGHGPMGDPHELIEKEIMRKKASYLNKPFFLLRFGFYFAVWILVAMRLFKLSTDQDKSKDPKLTLRAQALAPPATFLFALTLTFAAFDWIMSLEPTWFSTIFGVVIFACGVVSSYAVLILTTLALRSSGPLDGAVTIEHYHDLGKLMFGFLVFWAYVSFSQYMLIWYAALPEETTFFHNRWDFEPWGNVSMAIILFHFVAPFFWTISRNFKRNVGRLRIGALIIIVMHVVDIYWFVMPNFHLGKPGFSFHWLDAACLLAVVGIYGAFVFHRMTQFSLVPVGDPRLQRSLHFQNA